MYLAGFLGLQFQITKPIFLSLTAFNLWSSAILLLLFHENWSKKVAFYFAIIFVAAFFIEMAGVKTGIIFGNYSYGKTLGIKLLDVPLCIGANWLLLCYVFTYVCKTKFTIQNDYLIALLSSSLITTLDFLIEPIAIKFDFWSWQNNQIPLQNYTSWFIIAFGINLLLLKQNLLIKNKIASILLLLQILFFVSQNIFK